MLNFKKMSKLELRYRMKHLFQVVFGAIALSFGTAIFLVNLNIVSGGISGISIIVQNFIPSDLLGGKIIDIISFVLTWILWLIGLIFVGKDFAIKTLATSIIFPLSLSLFLRVPLFAELSETICYYGCDETLKQAIINGTESAPIGNLLICGMFGGFFIGTGVAFNFKGGGSSGGVDVFIVLGNKLFGIKESILSICVDGIVILCGMFLIPNNVVPSLCGIITAVIAALMIEYFYVGKQTSLQADIISNKWEEISSFVQDTLGRGTTIINAQGGFKGDNRVILRVVFDKTQYKDMREYIGRIDPTAFMTFTQTFGVYGEGFNKNGDKKVKKTWNKKDSN